METVVLTWRPANILALALMVAVILTVYWTVAKAGSQAVRNARIQA